MKASGEDVSVEIAYITQEAFMLHGNVLHSPIGRLKIANLIVGEGWSYRRAAERFETAKK